MAQHHQSDATLDAVFLDAQKRRLEALRDQLVGTADAAAGNEEGLALESVDEVRDSADSAETMAMEENDEAIYRHNLERLAAARRALEKLAEGSYGLSDIGGKPIPRARLEAIPEAVYNVGEKSQA
jgi:DnaK suppressor protein